MYKVRQDRSSIHDVYEESIDKVFNPPVEIDARIDWDPSEVRSSRFGQENYYTITVYLQSRDLLDKDIDVEAGKLGRQMKLANERGSRLVTVQGPDEKAAGEITIKDMESGEQRTVPEETVVAVIEDLLR